MTTVILSSLLRTLVVDSQCYILFNMASRQRRTQKNRQHPYSGNENGAVSSNTSSQDMANSENWTSAKFREELQKLGINIPRAWPKSVLKQLYADNKERCASSHVIQDVDGAEENLIWPDQQATPTTTNYVNSSLTSSQDMRRNDTTTGNGNEVNNVANIFAATIASTFAQCLSGLQQSVNTSTSDGIP